MEQSTPTKPVMDVTPPKPPAASAASASALPPTDSANAGPAAHGGPSSVTIAEATAGASKESLTVHQAPPMSDDDKVSTEVERANNATSEQKKKPAVHTAAPKSHGPAGAIILVILGMMVLSALAILVYLNS